jgi:lipopolysaccharide export LptBFGC system permease protein LptF
LSSIDGYLNAFAAIQFIALLASVMTLIAAYFSRVKRQATWYNFMISIAVYTTSFLLLFFAGQMNNPKPPYMLCLVQSSLTYAATPL